MSFSVSDFNKRIYLAPMQGNTDFVYRRIYNRVFGGIDKYFTPFISFESDGSIRTSRLKEILPENNIDLPVVPQILAGDKVEAIKLAQLIKDYGYSSVNLNLGCPFPMIVKRGKGCALLRHPERIAEILDALCGFDLKVSVKSRTGLINHNEFENVIPVLNSFLLEEIIIHPRIGEQQYKGLADIGVFMKYKGQLTSPVVYNGDVDGSNFQKYFTIIDVPAFMIGRGILRNPFLLSRISNNAVADENSVMRTFLLKLMEEYKKALIHETHVLNKMQEQFEYLADWFQPEWKMKKKIKKAKTLADINEAINTFK